MRVNSEDRAPLPVEGSLAEVSDPSKPLRNSALAELSDLDRGDVQVLRRLWGKVAVERRREIVSRLAELAEDNFGLDFDRVFLSALEDPDPQVRARAATGLNLCQDAVVIAPLVMLLTKDESGAVRIAAAQTLGKFILLGELEKAPQSEAERARQALLSVLEDKKQDRELRRRALESISPWTFDRVTEHIANFYRSAEPGFKASAIYSMGMNCDARWLPALFSELKNSDPRLRYEAAHAVGEVGEQSAVPHLLPLLRDDDIEVRIAAIWALGEIGGKAAKEALRLLILSPDERVKDAVEEALSDISLGEDVISP